MAKGTWQGSGTWQSSGPDLEGLVPVLAAVFVAVVAVVVAEWLLARIWWIIGGTVVIAAVAVAVVVALARWTGRREAAFAARRREVAGPAAAGLPRAEAPAIEHHVHYHLHAAPVSPARIVIPGTAGDAITEGK